MTGRPSRMRVASIAALNLGWDVRRWVSKECNNTHYGGLTVLYGVEILACPEPGWFPLGVVPRAKPVAPLRNDIIVISPPTLRHNERSRLSVVGFIVGKAIPSGTCGHAMYAEFGRRRKLELICYRGGGGRNPWRAVVHKGRFEESSPFPRTSRLEHEWAPA